MAKVTRINHATLVVDDLAAAADFYRDQLGLEPLPAIWTWEAAMHVKFA